MKTLEKLQHSDFIPFLNRTFQVHLEGVESISLELVGVTPVSHAFGPEVRQPFSLHFLGPVSPHYLPQHIYRLEHEEMGALDLFLVPLGPESARMRYEAIFA
jgi:hypothetical protein